MVNQQACLLSGISMYLIQKYKKIRLEGTMTYDGRATNNGIKIDHRTERVKRTCPEINLVVDLIPDSNRYRLYTSRSNYFRNVTSLKILT